MMSYTTLLAAVLPVFAIAGLGCGARAWKWVSPEGEQSLVKVVVNLLYPCLVFRFVLGNDSLRDVNLLLTAAGSGFFIVAVSIYLSLWSSRWLRGLDTEDRRSFAVTTGVYNFGYIAIPVATVLFDPATIGVMLVLSLGVEVGIWSVGMIVLTGATSFSMWKKMVSPPIVAMIVAIPLNFVHGADWLPASLLKTINMLGDCAIPMAVFMVGTSFYDLGKGARLMGNPRVAVLSVIMRLGILPLLMLTMTWLPVSQELKQVIVVHAAMPCGIFTIIMAKMYINRGLVALQAVLATSFVSLATMPLWLRLGISMISE